MASDRLKKQLVSLVVHKESLVQPVYKLSPRTTDSQK